MPFCPNCGTESVGSGKFCKECGATLYGGEPSAIPTPIHPNTPSYAVQQKDPTAALLLALIPGLVGFLGIGHIYLGHIGLGIGLLIGGLALGFIMVMFWVFFGSVKSYV